MSSTRRNRVLTLLGRQLDLRGQSDRSVLDIGIGSGEIGKYCAERADARRLYTEGIDLAQPLVQEHAKVYTKTRACNVDDPDWTKQFSRQFDVIVASEILEHLFRPDVFLGQLRLLVKGDGCVILTTPNLLLWTKRIKFLFGLHEYGDSGLFEWGHIHLFSWRFLKKLVHRSGFRIVDSYHLMHPNMLNRWHRFMPGLLAFQFIIVLTPDVPHSAV
ncbi:MAG: hypothetical protein A3B30_04335 [Candidatus Komeilibacteria bacterium RIFCSPLOWO2_01_FULL_52_15]|uniref:Methyltransferase type 11 domain-containing protein n=2 Tax=Candidatus Komeiliibacteriota TaxID=1817908 RepID=A0A1G2BPT5_9BACT|nr:MAG: hypothetical protein A2677_04095 [Candidatus Komeilibacteria bacterium RIFCSPHIGHO2_01_FULL_52_14]OGY91111.1 MAG: hypothetical protein A3B30_04335 [Candidatus Komeilibacteria bacterium RIFCSPLOWO2_01_FULL_52_15]